MSPPTANLIPLLLALGLTHTTLAQGLPTIPVFGDGPMRPTSPPASPSSTEPAPPSQQESPPKKPWLETYSNLPADQRITYQQELLRAKQAYQNGRTDLCLLILGNCKLIFDGNPHVWNLEANCLMDQHRFEEAAACIEKAKPLMPDSDVVRLNESSILLAQAKYDQCIASTEASLTLLRGKISPLVTDILRYHILLSHLMMDREARARDQITGLTPLSDTPLYYMAQAAFCTYHGDIEQANQNLSSAQAIFASTGQLFGFLRAFHRSQLPLKAQSSSSRIDSAQPTPAP